MCAPLHNVNKNIAETFCGENSRKSAWEEKGVRKKTDFKIDANQKPSADESKNLENVENSQLREEFLAMAIAKKSDKRHLDACKIGLQSRPF